VNDAEIEQEIIIADRMFLGKKLVGVSALNGGEKFTFEDGSSYWHALHIPVNEHKLALLEKALELCNRPTWGDSEDADSSYWIHKAAMKLADPIEWKRLEPPIIWPQWIRDRKDPPV
jgi:hypothetical protein